MTYDGGPRRPAPVAALGRLNDALLRLCRWAVIGLVAAIAVIVIASVIMRYVFNDSLSWSEDAAKFLMVWLAFIGAPLGFRHGAHVSIELLPPGLPPLAHRIIRVFVHATVLVLMVLLTRYAWAFAWNGRPQVALTVGDISMFWIFVCMPIGTALMALVALELMVLTILGIPEPAISEEDVITTQGM
ncbi:MAG: TRAP transporter small permease [Hyphomicrobiaceae bacterium]